MVLSVCTRGFSCLWSIYVVVILFCKIIFMKNSLFLCWFHHGSDCLIINLRLLWNNGGFNFRFYCYLWLC